MVLKKTQVLFTLGVVLVMGSQLIASTLAATITSYNTSSGWHGIQTHHYIFAWGAGEHYADYQLSGYWDGSSFSSPYIYTYSYTNCLRTGGDPYVSGNSVIVWNNYVRNWIWEPWINDGHTIAKSGNAMIYGYQEFWQSSANVY